MRVDSLYNYNIFSQNKGIRQTNSVSTPLRNFGISFKGNIEADTVNFDFSKGLEKLKDFSIKEYKTLSEEELQALREGYANARYEYGFDRTFCEKLHDKAAEGIRETLDEKYGEGKYKVITIGRSLSSIGKVLGYKIGEENVINIPMSDARRYKSDSYIESLDRRGQLDELRKFLAEQDLKKTKIKKSDKTYVIIDFCFTGSSLEGAEKLLTQEKVLGKKNITSMNVEDCIKDNYTRWCLYQVLRDIDYKFLSFVKKVYDIEEMPKAFINTQKESMPTKLMWFKLLDNEMHKEQQP